MLIAMDNQPLMKPRCVKLIKRALIMETDSLNPAVRSDTINNFTKYQSPFINKRS
jgi:hypothetical protein